LRYTCTKMQPMPDITERDVERVVRRDFTAAQHEMVFALLNEFGTEPWEREVPRVRCAILRLADGREEQLRYWLDIAKRDYRDVLACAENPHYFKSTTPPATISAADNLRLIKEDWRQYTEWLQKQ
jgi:hypothetical protein